MPDQAIDNTLFALQYLERATHILEQQTLRLAQEGGLDELIARFAAIRELRDTTKTLHAAINAIAERLADDLVPQALRNNRVTTITHAVGRVALTTRVSASILDREGAYQWLRGHDLGALIIETVNSQTLSATARSLLEQGDELPDDLFKTSMHTFATLTRPGPSKTRAQKDS